MGVFLAVSCRVYEFEVIPTRTSAPSWNIVVLIGLSLRNSFIREFFSDGNFDVSPQCSSGNCTWDTYSSIGICSRCIDVTTVTPLNCHIPSIQKDFSKACNFALPGVKVPYNFEISFEHFSGGGILNTTRRIIYQPINSTSWSHQVTVDVREGEDTSERSVLQYNLPNMTWASVKNPLTAIAYVELDINQTGNDSSSIVSPNIYIKNATECSLSACLRDYHISVRNGKASIETQNIDFGTMYLKTKDDRFDHNGVRNNATALCWKPEPSNSTTFQDMNDFVFCDDSMVLLDDVAYHLPSNTKESISLPRTNIDLDRWVPTYFYYPPIPSENDRPRMEYFQRVGFEDIMENIAASLTKFGLQNANHSVNGDVQVTKVFVSVRWPWIILPALLVLVGTIFFAATTAVSKKVIYLSGNPLLWRPIIMDWRELMTMVMITMINICLLAPWRRRQRRSIFYYSLRRRMGDLY